MAVGDIPLPAPSLHGEPGLQILTHPSPSPNGVTLELLALWGGDVVSHASNRVGAQQDVSTCEASTCRKKLIRTTESVSINKWPQRSRGVH